MFKSSHHRANVLGSVATIALSSMTMLWLFWRFPLSTGIAAITVLSALGLSAGLNRSIDTDNRVELEHGKPGL